MNKKTGDSVKKIWRFPPKKGKKPKVQRKKKD